MPESRKELLRMQGACGPEASLLAIHAPCRYIASAMCTGDARVEYAHRKHFSVAEAQAALATVGPLAEEIVQLKDALDRKGYDIHRHEYFGGRGPNGDRIYPPELERLVSLAHRLEDQGILLKGIDNGLVDFPHVRANGDEVYLCYKSGEPTISFWHSLTGGYAARRPIDEL